MVKVVALAAFGVDVALGVIAKAGVDAVGVDALQAVGCVVAVGIGGVCGASE